MVQRWTAVLASKESCLFLCELEELLERVNHMQNSCAARFLVPHELTQLAQLLIRDEDGRVAQDALRLHDAEHAFAVAALLLLRGGIDHELEFDDDNDGHD